MLSTINKILNDNNLTMTCCRASYTRQRIDNESFYLEAYCEFSGAVARKLVPIFYHFMNDSGMEVVHSSISEDESKSGINVFLAVKELPVIIKHFVELSRNVFSMDICLSIKDNNLHLEAIKETGRYNANVAYAYPNSVIRYNSSKAQTTEIYTYNGWLGFMATEFEDVVAKADQEDWEECREEWRRFCEENTYRFTVSCPSGIYYYTARPQAGGSNRQNTSVERYAKAYDAWKDDVNRYQKGLISFYTHILNDFICLAKEEYPEVLAEAGWLFCNDYGSRLMPEHYENFVITKMEKMENCYEDLEFGMIKAHRCSS